MTTVFEYMQMAVDEVSNSPHPGNKIAACLAYQSPAGDKKSVTATNKWPASIETAIGRQTRIGNSSGTIHAETACILLAENTKDADLFITDPPCPNCAKNIAEAGIKNLYIDHKGFEKDFAIRRGDDFQAMSMRIFEHAGMNVFKIHRKEEKIIPVLESPDGFAPVSEHPLQIISAEKAFPDHVRDLQSVYGDEPFAACLARNMESQDFILHARRHPAVGYTQHDDLTKEGKYSFIVQPVNRLLMGCKFYGLSLVTDHLFSSRVPTSRELVNMVGADIQTLTIGNMQDSRDEYCISALEQLKQASIIKTQIMDLRT